MAVDEKMVRQIAKLAKIKVSDNVVTSLTTELEEILGWIEQLNEVDTSNVEPVTSVIATEFTTRNDEVVIGNKREDVLANAPEVGKHFYTVPKVVE
ncbi:MAG: Asp-tRNA(Asn)/Glu-tRNA(Gln) amidotransferase subunit GatC [Pseudomonadota bacterium]|nr:Asp-tRNA(Asn)/Glu-tRNA(Gln) amidotransferase subunit GatC [Pseudomonadota bacterium]